MIKFLSVLFIPLCLFFMFGSVAKAEDAAGVTITPHIIDEKVKARDNLDYTVKIRNNMDRKVDIYAMVYDILEESGQQEFIDPNLLDKSESLARWIEFQRAVIELVPGEEKEIPLHIQVNAAAKPGKRHASITLAQGNNRTIAETNMKTMSYPQLMINLEVAEDIIEKAQINDFRSDHSTYIRFPVTFSLEVTNSGNREIIPSGVVYIYNRRGQEVDKLDINEAGEKVAAGENKNFTVAWTDGHGFGKFKAKLEAEYGAVGKRDLSDTVYFWMLPLSVLLIYGGGLVLLITIATIIIFKKTYHGHPQAHAQPQVLITRKQPAAGHGVLDLRK